MKNVAVIAEFDPFHLGHKKLCEKIKEKTKGCTVTAIMSGYFTQRGHAALLPPLERAQRAVRSGYDLVLSLPAPYSFSSAEYFARAGVSIAKKVGVFDALAFGHDCDDFEKLKKEAEITKRPDFIAALRAAPKNESHATVFERVFREFTGEAPICGGNDILAIEYLKNLETSSLSALPIKREKDGFSASEARSVLLSGGNASDICGYPISGIPLSHVPDFLFEFCRCAPELLNDKSAFSSPGMSAAFRAAAAENNDFDSFFAALGKKKYTAARLRRALICSVLRITPDDISAECNKINVLAFNERGRALLREISKKTEIEISSSPGVPESDIEHRARRLYYTRRGFTDKDFLSEKPIFIQNGGENDA